ncbi:MAG: CPBP family intramembrane metalloprotease [Paludibacteraceae bacterium]|nr:CPBP family intramembrane metalloprotease [Paludibacteraceae bacterium]
MIAFFIAFVLWTLMFSPWTAPYLPFWPCMVGSAVILIGLTLYNGRKEIKEHLSVPLRQWLIDIALGIGIAVALWGIFWIGDKVSQWIFPSFARQQVDGIYGIKDGINPVLLSCLLLLIIGPAEELFWRGYIQQTLMTHFQQTAHPVWTAALVAVAAYTLVHIFSLNFMLIMAALVCGVVWGGLYLLCSKHFPAILISHALWDAAVFVWFPIL